MGRTLRWGWGCSTESLPNTFALLLYCILFLFFLCFFCVSIGVCPSGFACIDHQNGFRVRNLRATRQGNLRAHGKNWRAPHANNLWAPNVENLWARFVRRLISPDVRILRASHAHNVGAAHAKDLRALRVWKVWELLTYVWILRAPRVTKSRALRVTNLRALHAKSQRALFMWGISELLAWGISELPKWGTRYVVMRTAYEALGMCPLYRHMADRRNEVFPSGSMAQGIARNATLEKQNASRTKHGSQDFAESGRV